MASWQLREYVPRVGQRCLGWGKAEADRQVVSYLPSVKGINVKEVIADAALIGMSAALLWHFSNIWRYGQHLVGEPNIAARSLETAGLLAILVFGGN